MVLNPFHISASSTSFWFFTSVCAVLVRRTGSSQCQRRGWQNELRSLHRKEQSDKSRWEDLQCYLHSVWLPVSVNARQQSAHLAERNLPHTLSLSLSFSQLISLLIWHLGFTGNKLLGLPKQFSHDTESECYMRNKYLLCSLFCSSSRAMRALYIFMCIFQPSKATVGFHVFSARFSSSSLQKDCLMSCCPSQWRSSLQSFRSQAASSLLCCIYMQYNQNV